MNSKRIKFALFICVFALYGCASSASVPQKSLNTVNNKHTVSPDTLHTNSLIQTKDTSMAAMAFHAYGPMQKSGSMFRSMRDEHGVLLMKSDVEGYAKKMKEKVVKERKRQVQLEKKRKEQERLKRMEKESSQAFSPKITTYGVDCYGCGGESGRGGTSLGVALDLTLGVQMPDGSWQPGIRYGNYYIVAADPSIPLCSILKISDHGLSGSGITPDQPYYAIVLDRGGAIQGNHIDLYIGSENSGAIVPVKNTQAKAQIIREGGKNGARSCAL